MKHQNFIVNMRSFYGKGDCTFTKNFTSGTNIESFGCKISSFCLVGIMKLAMSRKEEP